MISVKRPVDALETLSANAFMAPLQSILLLGFCYSSFHVWLPFLPAISHATSISKLLSPSPAFR